MTVPRIEMTNRIKFYYRSDEKLNGDIMCEGLRIGSIVQYCDGSHEESLTL